MAVILIVEDDTLIAQQTAHTLRGFGHRPILAADARAARLELTPPPDLILLDLNLPDLPGEVFLQWLGARPETARIPVLILTGRGDAATPVHVEAGTRRIAILKKPAARHHLDRAVTAALAPLTDHRRQEMIQHVIATGPQRLAAHVYRRMAADRVAGTEDPRADALTWAEIGRWATLAGVLDREQATLLASNPQYPGRGGQPSRPDDMFAAGHDEGVCRKSQVQRGSTR